jgi:peptide/nickel transport system substrate-binding protein
VIEQSSEDWLIAKTATQRDAAADAFQARAFANVPSIPLGQFQIRTAYRKNLAGVVEASGAFFRNVRRV